MACRYKYECPSYSGWCEGLKQDFSKCTSFLITAYENQRKENEVLLRRFRHLLESDTIALYDEVDPRTKEYMRDIKELDESVIILRIPKEILCSKEELKNYLYVKAQIEINKALNTCPRSK